MMSPYTWFTFIFFSLLPICVITTLALNMRMHCTKVSTTTSSVMVSRRDINRNIITNMLMVLSLFIVCTLPTRLLTIVVDMTDFQSSSLLLGLQVTSYILYSLQGTLNPILYSMLAREWRKSFVSLVVSVFRKERQENSIEMNVLTRKGDD